MIVTDEQVQNAFDVLNESRPRGKAAAKRKRQMDHHVRATRARLFLGYVGTVAERNARAECHPDLADAVEREADAIALMVEHNEERSDASALIDAWRTESANYRGMARVG